MRQYQLREMLKKICAIQKAKKRRNLLISAETFEYLLRKRMLKIVQSQDYCSCQKI